MTLAKMKVDRLRAELKSRGLSTAGTKPVLIGRLQAAIDADEPPSAPEADPATESARETAAQTVSLSAPTELAATEGATGAVGSDDSLSKPAEDPEVNTVEKRTESKTEVGGSKGGIVSHGVAGETSDVACLSFEKRVAARSARFGGTDEGRLAARARRFGLNQNNVAVASAKNGAIGVATAATTDPVSASEKSKRSSGGVAAGHMFVVSAEEQARRAKRAKRFAAES